MKSKNIKSNNKKLVLAPFAQLLALSSFVVGAKYEKQIKDVIHNQPTGPNF